MTKSRTSLYRDWFQYLKKTHIADGSLLKQNKFRCPLATSSVEDRTQINIKSLEPGKRKREREMGRK